MPPRERYERDPWFHALVDALHHHIREARFTPTEIREAAMLAQIFYEERHPRHVPSIAWAGRYSEESDPMDLNAIRRKEDPR
jgi:hypothetical protein